MLLPWLPMRMGTHPLCLLLIHRGRFLVRSIVDLFKQEQAELASSKSVFIRVNGYEQTGLQIRYKMPASGKELEVISSKVQRQHKDNYSRNLYTAMDTMIHLCDGLFVQPDGVERTCHA